MEFSHCETVVDKVFFSLGVCSVVLVILTGIGVYLNEDFESRGTFSQWFLGGFGFIFTTKYLNRTGKFFRIVFLIALSYLIAFLVFGPEFVNC